MFSGGNWQNKTYGVSFAVTDDIDRDEEWTQYSDGDKILPILRTIPEKVIGPGHNSVVRGPNNRELYCVYHRWTDAGRVLWRSTGWALPVIGYLLPVRRPRNRSRPLSRTRRHPVRRRETGRKTTAPSSGSRQRRIHCGVSRRRCLVLLELSIRFIAWSPEGRAGIKLR